MLVERWALFRIGVDTLAGFNIDSLPLELSSTDTVAEGRELENAPTKDGGGRPSFAGALHLQGA
jgi:hypothetical protein